jgi:putative phosphonate metabolism protein
MPRYAIYFTPAPDSRLDRFGAGVLGYDCFEALDVAQMSLPGVDPADLQSVTAEPRRYGFHATLKAPFRLANGSEAELVAAVSAFASRHAPIPVGPLEVAGMGSFVVLRPVQPNAEVEEFAAACVEAFEAFRAPLSVDERARRLGGGLSGRQIALVERWGYPYVFDEFRFHMTLAGPVPEHQRATMTTLLSHAFAAHAGDHLELGGISLMRQDDNAPFRVLSRQRLKGR